MALDHNSIATWTIFNSLQCQSDIVYKHQYKSIQGIKEVIARYKIGLIEMDWAFQQYDIFNQWGNLSFFFVLKVNWYVTWYICQHLMSFMITIYMADRLPLNIFCWVYIQWWICTPTVDSCLSNSIFPYINLHLVYI